MPATTNVRLHDMIMVSLGSNGGIDHVVDNTGGQTERNASNTPTVTALS